jgi:photosystem II stability/assembly factor-like uncharacterized protein
MKKRTLPKLAFILIKVFTGIKPKIILMKKNIFLLYLLILLSSTLYAQWIEINSSVKNHISDITFINDNTGFCIGQDGIIKTTNSGKTWNLINSSLSGSRIFFLNSSIGFVISGDAVFKSTNSGTTWDQVITLGNETPEDIHFTTSDIGYLITSIYGPPGGSFIYKTVNGGSSWVKTNSYPSIATLQAITFVNADTGFVVGYDGTIIKTDDAGASWTLSKIPSVNCLLSVCFPTDSIGYAAGYSNPTGSEIIKTIDAGDTWQPLATGGTLNTALRTISFCSIDTGFAAGEGGRIITTVNGGVSWQNSVTTFTDFYGSSFIKSYMGFVCGTKGTILKKNNGGLTNIQYHIPSYIKLFPNPATNWISIESNNLVNKKVALSLRNSTGKEVKHEIVEFSENYKMQLDHLQRGVYILSITSDQEQVNMKIIVEK